MAGAAPAAEDVRGCDGERRMIQVADLAVVTFRYERKISDKFSDLEM